MWDCGGHERRSHESNSVCGIRVVIRGIRVNHMAKTKHMKAEVLSRLDKIFSGSASIAFVNFHKLTVKNAQELRRKLRESKSGYFVAKKTLIRKALESTETKGTLPPLEGEIGVAYLESSDDITAPAREVFGFEKAVSLVGGIFEGLFKGREDMVALALIPSRQTLLAQFTNLVHSPLQRLGVALDQVAKKKSQ